MQAWYLSSKELLEFDLIEGMFLTHHKNMQRNYWPIYGFDRMRRVNVENLEILNRI